MPHLAWSVCLSACLCSGHTGELCKTAEPIEMPFWGLTFCGPGNHVLDGVEIPHGKRQFSGLSGPFRSIVVSAIHGTAWPVICMLLCL